jgi:H+/Cl- antiporter ClcA
MVPGGVLVSLASLVGGFSLGPEVPTGMIAGGVAAAVADKQDWDDDTRKVTFASSLSATYAGLFTSPFVAVMLELELAPPRHRVIASVLVIQVVAALVGFAVFFAVGGFASLLAELSLPTYQFELWHFVVAAGMAVVAVGIGALTAALAALFKRMAAPLADHLFVRGALAGFALGLLGMAVPLTLFSGATTLPLATSEAAGLGAAMLIISLVAKIAAMTAAQAFGFIGGPIFPLVFAGGALGAAVHSIAPDIPLALTVTTGMAAVPAAVLPLPLSLGILAIVIAGTGMGVAPAVLTASVLATTLVKGLKRTTSPVGSA